MSTTGKRRWPLATGTGIVGLVIGGVLGASGSSTTTTTAAPSVTVTAQVGDAAESSATAGAAPKAGISEGVWVVGEDFPAGTYRVVKPLSAEDGCYWEISRAGSNGQSIEDIVSNDNPTGGRPRVRLKRDQGFKTQGCGDWAKV